MNHSDHFAKTETASGKATGYFLPRSGDTMISNQEDLGYTVVVLSNTDRGATPVAEQIRQWIAFSAQE